MLFWSFFKSLSEQQAQQAPIKVVLELKNDLKIAGTLSSVDESLNFYLTNMKVVDEEHHPYLMSCKNGFIRGNTVRYVHLVKKEVDTEPLTEACKREAKKDKLK